MFNSVSIPINRVTNDIEIKVKITGIKQWIFRLWVARQLLKVASLIAPINIEIENTGGN